MGILSTGLNIYLKPRTRFIFDIGAANVRDTADTGELYFVQTRFQVEF